MPAFEHAVSLGYRYLETDVHVTADGVLVAFHDTDLARTCGHARRDHRHDVGGAGHVARRRSRTDPADARPARALARGAIQHRLQSGIGRGAAGPTDRIDAIDRPGVSPRSATPPETLRQRLGPRLLTALSPQEIGSLRLIGRLAGAARRRRRCPRRRDARVAAGGSTSSRRRSSAAPTNAVPVHVWTIDDEAEMHRLLDLGVDGIMTDRPEVLRDVLESRGLWRD